MEAIHKQKSEKTREKVISDQFEARRVKNKATRERKAVRRTERLTQVCTAGWSPRFETLACLIANSSQEVWGVKSLQERDMQGKDCDIWDKEGYGGLKQVPGLLQLAVAIGSLCFV